MKLNKTFIIVFTTFVSVFVILISSCDSADQTPKKNSIGLQKYAGDSTQINPNISRSSTRGIPPPTPTEFFDQHWSYDTTADPSEQVLDKVFDPAQRGFSYLWAISELDAQIANINKIVTSDFEIQPDMESIYKISSISEMDVPAAFDGMLVVTFNTDGDSSTDEVIPIQGIVQQKATSSNSFAIDIWKAAFYKDSQYERVMIFQKRGSTEDDAGVELFYGVKDKINKMTYVRYVTSNLQDSERLLVWTNELTINLETKEFSIALGYSIQQGTTEWPADSVTIFGGGVGGDNTILRKLYYERTGEAASTLKGDDWFVMDNALQKITGNYQNGDDIGDGFGENLNDEDYWITDYDLLEPYILKSKGVSPIWFPSVMISSWD